MSNIPKELLYTKDHEWIQLTGDTAVIGITDHAQNALGDVVYVDLPMVDDEFEVGEEFGTVESVKAVSPLYMPITGVVLESNTELNDQPELINSDCYEDGWLVRIKITHDEREHLLDAETYEQFLTDESE